jgi:phage/plasmid-like protein (TIGR03299 family)
MAAEVETMFYAGREKPWHGLGTQVEEALTSADALKAAGLDWEVKSEQMQILCGKKIPGYRANVRSSDGKVLGVVTDRYKIVQNTDAFAFTDALIGDDVRYETAGSLLEGKRVWLLAKLPDREVVGDKVEPYLCFTNSHDGTGAVRICMTPVRVVCNNTLNFAFQGASRQWSTKHIGDMEQKMDEARKCLEMANAYMNGLDQYAQQMIDRKVDNDEIQKILEELFPLKEGDGKITEARVHNAKAEFMSCYFMPDIEQFRGTAWGLVNAMADMVDHGAPKRKTETYQENNWGRIMDGHKMVDAMANLAGVR